ncbi:MAG: glutamate racemase [Patescibacteria group bacterium]
MIGIFDSGLGGLAIFKEIKKLIPEEDLYYYGDTANVPYGEKPTEEIKEYISNSIKLLENKGCNIIVLACNTASVLDINYFRSLTKIPIIAVVPVIKTAAKLTKNKKIALLATKNTIKSPYVDYLCNTFASGCKIKKIHCPGLVSAIEKDTLTDNFLKKCVKKAKKQDVVILGSTHYALIGDKIKKLLDEDTEVIDSNRAVAKQVLRIANKEKLLHYDKKPEYIFDCSGDKDHFMKMVTKYI